MSAAGIASNRLPDLLAPLLSSVPAMRRNPPQGDAAQVRAELCAQLADVGRRAQNHGVGNDDWADARYAVAAWIDEMLNTSSWAHRGDWMMRGLAQELYDDPNAGEGFYDRLAEITRSARSRRKELLEVYATCMHLGFRGRLITPQDAEQHRQTLAATLRELESGAPGEPLAPTAEAKESVQEKLRRFPLWGYAVAVLGLLLILHVTLSWVLGSGRSELEHRLLEATRTE